MPESKALRKAALARVGLTPSCPATSLMLSRSLTRDKSSRRICWATSSGGADFSIAPSRRWLQCPTSASQRRPRRSFRAFQGGQMIGGQPEQLPQLVVARGVEPVLPLHPPGEFMAAILDARSGRPAAGTFGVDQQPDGGGGLPALVPPVMPQPRGEQIKHARVERDFLVLDHQRQRALQAAVQRDVRMAVGLGDGAGRQMARDESQKRPRRRPQIGQIALIDDRVGRRLCRRGRAPFACRRIVCHHGGAWVLGFRVRTASRGAAMREPKMVTYPLLPTRRPLIQIQQTFVLALTGRLWLAGISVSVAIVHFRSSRWAQSSTHAS